MRTLYFLLIVLMVSLSFHSEAKDPYRGKSIKIVYANKWAPVSYVIEGQIKGLLPKRMEELLVDKMGMKIEHIPVPWGRAQKMVESGAADAFVTTVTPARLAYAHASRSKVFILPFVPAVKKYSTTDHLLNNPDDLSQFTDGLFCDVLGNGWADYFYKDKPVQVHIVPTIKECLHLLMAERATAVIHARPVLIKYIQELNLEKSLVVKENISERSPKFSLMVSKKSPLGIEFIEEFDKFFESFMQNQKVTE